MPTFYPITGALVNGFVPTQQDGTAPADAATSPATGWIVGANTAGTSQDMAAGLIQPRTGWSASGTREPTNLITGTNGNGFRSPNALTGSFAAANWTFSMVLRSFVAAIPTGMTVRANWRVFASTNANGSGARELTSAALQGTAVAGTGNLTANMSASTVTWAAPAITLTGEYLFFASGLEIGTLSGTGNTRQANIRQNPNTSAITSTFTAITVKNSIAGGTTQATGAASSTQVIKSSVGAAATTTTASAVPEVLSGGPETKNSAASAALASTGAGQTSLAKASAASASAVSTTAASAPTLAKRSAASAVSGTTTSAIPAPQLRSSQASAVSTTGSATLGFVLKGSAASAASTFATAVVLAAPQTKASAAYGILSVTGLGTPHLSRDSRAGAALLVTTAIVLSRPAPLPAGITFVVMGRPGLREARAENRAFETARQREFIAGD